MNTRTILSFAKMLSDDLDLVDSVISTKATEHIEGVADMIGGSMIKFCHEHFDLFGKICTGKESLLSYKGPLERFVVDVALASYGELMPLSPQARDNYAFRARGVSFDELLRRDFMRAICNAEWLYNKQVFEFSDELITSLVSDSKIVTFKELTNRNNLSADKFLTTVKNEEFIEMKLFVDRINTLPFKSFVLDVSGNMFFSNSGIHAVQVTPLYYIENRRAVIHTEVIVEGGKIHGSYTYDLDFDRSPNAVVTDDDCTYARVILYNTEEIQRILHGGGGTPFDIAKDAKSAALRREPYNSIIGALVVQVINYLGSDDADIEESPDTKATYRPQQKHSKIKNSYKELQKWDCGFHYAQAVREYHARRDAASTEGVGSPKRPHVRRAHWHHYWVGSGDKKRLVRKWLLAINVKMDFSSQLHLTIHKEN